MKDHNKNPLPYFAAILIILTLTLVLSNDRFTWILEVFPVLIGLPILLLTYRRFPFTDLVYSLIVLHTLILAVGGVYTYAKVPLGFWMQDWFGFARNHYDRIGHFAQGFIPALLTREIIIRTSPLRKGKWLNFITVSICLAVSAFYELIEFAYAMGTGETAESFLGSQGDIWDAQWDMTFALMGAVLALVFISKFHDAQLKKIHVDVNYN
jgi:putative membrane protein